MNLAELLYELTKNLPMKIIPINDEPYLERYFVCEESDGTQQWLHHILRSDSERWLHTHPFNAISRILVGGYLEERFCPDPTGITKGAVIPVAYRPGSCNQITMETLHRIVRAEPNTWTLMTVKPERNPTWRFIGEEGERVQRASDLDWHTYRGNRAEEYSKLTFAYQQTRAIDAIKRSFAVPDELTQGVSAEEKAAIGDMFAHNPPNPPKAPPTRRAVKKWGIWRKIKYALALLIFCAVISFVDYGVEHDCPNTATFVFCYTADELK